MKFSLSFFLAATALLSASGSIADEVAPGSSGCSASETSCWASCYEGESRPEIDASNTWEEGEPWCWLVTQTDSGEGWDWLGCEDDSSCSLDGRAHFCDYVTRDSCQT